MVLAAVGTGMIVSAAVSVWQQSLQFAESRREVLLATAHVFSAAVALPASNNDAAGAFAAIRAIGNVPDLLYAEVRGADGRTLATLGSTPRLVGDASLDGNQSVFDLLFSQTVQVTVPIVHGGAPSGQLVLIGGTSGLWERLLGTVATTAVGGALALVVGLIVGWRFQRRITRPLRQLVSTMARVREQHKYDVAIEDADDREIGLLIDGFNAMLNDIRERDVRLETHRRNLERDIADRTRDLRVARDAAEAANRAKSDFLATMSHEIRTPMNGIMVMAELLAQGELPPRQRRCADVIVNSGQSLLAIINDILDFSKIEAGKLELERVPFNVAQLADTTVSLFAERARSKNVDLAALVDPATPRMIASDPVRLTQIVANLVNNALKFTERGYVNVTIAPTVGRPGHLTIAVTDTGVGIPADKLDTIFDAFSQADQSTTRHYGGTGLGLAICKRLVTALGGHIGVTSAHGKGAAFTVIIPATPADTAQPSRWPQLALELGRHATCVVDLEGEATIAAMSRYFAAAGYVVIRPDEQLAAAEYDNAAVLCVSADKLLSAAPQRPHGGRPIVIAVAALGDDVSAQRLIEAGVADAVLTKPLLRAEVEDLLARLVSGDPLTSSIVGGKDDEALEFPGLRVLVADDSEVNREVAIAALSRLGAVTHTVENGAQAIAAVQNEAFDVVLMDGSMPDVDGFEAARRIRAIELQDGRKRLPIVALTAHVIGTSAQAWSDAGMDAVVYKPYTLGQLRACFHKLIPQWSADAERNMAEGLPAEEMLADPPGDAAPAQDGMLDMGILRELQEMVGADGEKLVQRVFRLYVENARRSRDELARAIALDDREGCARAAHALKSMSQNIGARRVAANADAIERYAREDSTPEPGDLQSLDMVLDATIAAIAMQLEAERVSRSAA